MDITVDVGEEAFESDNSSSRDSSDDSEETLEDSSDFYEMEDTSECDPFDAGFNEHIYEKIFDHLDVTDILKLSEVSHNIN
jgi:hypothetical protein